MFIPHRRGARIFVFAFSVAPVGVGYIYPTLTPGRAWCPSGFTVARRGARLEGPNFSRLKRQSRLARRAALSQRFQDCCSGRPGARGTAVPASRCTSAQPWHTLYGSSACHAHVSLVSQRDSLLCVPCARWHVREE